MLCSVHDKLISDNLPAGHKPEIVLKPGNETLTGIVEKDEKELNS